MFSCFARRLAKLDAKTLPDLILEISSSYTRRVKVERLVAMLDAKAWMADHVSNLAGHIHQHQFKIVRNADGKAEVDV